VKGRFLISTLIEFPTLKDPRGAFLPEIALAGRSNVGKSSLINHLLGQKKLAKISATPGKTQLLNFFVIDERFLLVDLPGYGFAKAPREEVEKWSSAIDSYLHQSTALRLILLLVDSRRELGKQDQCLIQWAEDKKIPLFVIFTKTDKLSRAEQEALLKKYPESILFSIVDRSSRHLVERKIEQILWD